MKIDKDAKLIAEAYAKVQESLYSKYSQMHRDRGGKIEDESRPGWTDGLSDFSNTDKESSVKLDSRTKLVYDKPFTTQKGDNVYYVIFTPDEKDPTEQYHTLIFKDGRAYNHIELTSEDRLSEDQVQQYINVGMPTSYDIAKELNKQVGGSFTADELDRYIKLKTNK